MAVNRIRTTAAVPPKVKSSANWKSSGCPYLSENSTLFCGYFGNLGYGSQVCAGLVYTLYDGSESRSHCRRAQKQDLFEIGHPSKKCLRKLRYRSLHLRISSFRSIGDLIFKSMNNAFKSTISGAGKLEVPVLSPNR
jgi:hypothetical protein